MSSANNAREFWDKVYQELGSKIPLIDPEFRDRWVAALRSGQYQQGRGKLRGRDDKFCCLGVACDLIAPNSWGLLIYSYYFDDYRAEVFPRGRFRNLGMRGSIDDVALGTLYAKLANLNDDGFSFDEIADIIEDWPTSNDEVVLW